MKFNGVEHYDHFYDETIFWAEISDLPQNIQDKARVIDGAEYNADCFGACIDYNWTTKEFAIVTDTDLSTGDIGNIYYVDNDGDKHWFKVDLAQEFANQIFAACDKINAGKDTIHGYEVKKSVLFENGRGVALAENPKAAEPFVTWMFTEDAHGRRDYEWGHYTTNKDKAEVDFEARVSKYQEDYGISIKPERRVTEATPKRIAEQLAEAAKQIERGSGADAPAKKQNKSHEDR